MGRARRLVAPGLVLSTMIGGGLVATAGPALAESSPICGTPVTASGFATVTCAYIGGPQSFTVPAGVTRATFTLYGAEGGPGAFLQPESGTVGGGSPVGPAAGGLGAKVVATVRVTPGTVLQVNVGGAGVVPVNGSQGGFNGGGAGGHGGGGGGGASDVRLPASGQYPLADRILVAGGGGGGGLNGMQAGAAVAGGAGGNSRAAGGAGTTVTADSATLGGGGGGAPGEVRRGGAGGAAGAVSGSTTCPPSQAGQAGSGGALGVGGAGATFGAGGGAGGYHGGGGGAGSASDSCTDMGGAGGGGGGSSYTGKVKGARVENGVAAPTGSPNGEVIIRYALPHRDLNIALHAHGVFRSHRAGELRVRVTNTGTGPAPYAQAVISLPGGLTPAGRVKAAGWVCRAHGRTETCLHHSAVPAHYRVTLALRVRISAAAGRMLTVRAALTPGNDSDNRAVARVRVR